MMGIKKGVAAIISATILLLIIDRYLDASKHKSLSNFQQALHAYNAREYLNAENLFRTALKNDQNNPLGLHYLAKTLMQLDRPQSEIEDAYALAIQHAGEHPLAADAAMEIGEYKSKIYRLAEQARQAAEQADVVARKKVAAESAEASRREGALARRSMRMESLSLTESAADALASDGKMIEAAAVLDTTRAEYAKLANETGVPRAEVQKYRQLEARAKCSVAVFRTKAKVVHLAESYMTQAALDELDAVCKGQTSHKLFLAARLDIELTILAQQKEENTPRTLEVTLCNYGQKETEYVGFLLPKMSIIHEFQINTWHRVAKGACREIKLRDVEIESRKAKFYVGIHNRTYVLRAPSDKFVCIDEKGTSRGRLSLMFDSYDDHNTTCPATKTLINFREMSASLVDNSIKFSFEIK